MSRKLVFGLLVFSALLITTAFSPSASNAAGETSVWGYIYVNGRQVTRDNARSIVGEYPVVVHFDRLPAYNGDQMGRVDVTTYQTLTGYNSLYYSGALRAGNGPYMILVRVRGEMKICRQNVQINGNQQINCWL